MSKQLAISSCFAIFAMVSLAVLGTPKAERNGTSGKASVQAEIIDPSLPALPFSPTN